MRKAIEPASARVLVAVVLGALTLAIPRPAGTTTLLKMDIERMVEDAATHAADDERRAALATARAELSTALYTLRSMLEAEGFRLEESERRRLAALVARADAVLADGEGRELKLMSARLGAEAERLSGTVREA